MDNMKFLPIGTVVTLKEEKKKVIIIGYKVSSEEEPEKTYDYAGYFYPGGFSSRYETVLFNVSDINQIYYYGFKNKEYEEFLDYMGGEGNV